MDKDDQQILRILQRDNRTTSAGLGKEIGLSVSAVNERVRRLNASGVITGNHAHVAPDALGVSLCAFVFIDLAVRANEDLFRRAIDKLGGIQELHHVSGPHAYLAKLRVADTSALHALLTTIKTLPGVDGTETIIALGTDKETSVIETSLPGIEKRKGQARRWKRR